MGECLRHVPILLAARCAEGRLGEHIEDGGKLDRHRLLLREEAHSVAIVHARPQLATQGDEASSAPVEDLPAGGHVGRGPRQARLAIGPGVCHGSTGCAYRRSKRSTGRTNTVAPPTSTSTG